MSKNWSSSFWVSTVFVILHSNLKINTNER
jgi:hypothetical protein